MNKHLFTYKKSGVDINAADNFVKFISNFSRKKEEKKILATLAVLDLLQTYQKILKNQKLLPVLTALALK